jgi:hypothetical protein
MSETNLKYRNCEITVRQRPDGLSAQPYKRFTWMAEIPPTPYGEMFYIDGELDEMPEGEALENWMKEVYNETWRQYRYEYASE